MGRIMGNLSFMERIGNSKTGNVSFRGGGTTVTIEAWPKKDRAFLRSHRNLFAHGETTVQADGTVVITDPRDGKKQEFKLPAILALERRIDDTIYGGISTSVEVSQVCGTCGVNVPGHEFLRCGHVTYKEDEQQTHSPLGRKAAGATLNIKATFGGRNKVTHEGPGQMVITKAGIRSLIESTESMDIQFSDIRQKCQCGNTAAADGYCKRCRPIAS